MSPFVFGMITGGALALLNFLASAYYSSRIISHDKMISVLLLVIGFLTRLTAIGIIFYGLTRVKWIHFQTALISFVLVFTLCAIWKAARIYREAKPFLKQQTEI